MDCQVLFESVQQVHISDPKYAVGETTTIAEAIRLMQNFHIGSLLIVSEKVQLIGIVTERDMLFKVLGKNMALSESVETIMTKNPQRLSPRSTVIEAISLMAKGKYRHLPIVNDLGVPTGMISVKDIVSYMAANISLPTPR